MTYPRSFLILLTVGLLALGSAGVALGDDDDDDDDERGEGRERGEYREDGGRQEFRASLASPVNATYKQECGSCHMAYQPGLLPALAWARIMDPAALASHYGDDASLPAETVNEITTYLTANAADQTGEQRARAFAVGTPGITGPGETLPRITETAYFKHEHDEIPARLVTGNPDVGSFSQCNACHRTAPEGNYDEGQIDIPGHGRWED